MTPSRTYLRVRWIHQFPDEPVEIFSELDKQSREHRKVEVFPDGSMGFADVFEAYGSTRLANEPIPELTEIAADPQFVPERINKDHFEVVWNAAQQRVGQIR